MEGSIMNIGVSGASGKLGRTVLLCGSTIHRLCSHSFGAHGRRCIRANSKAVNEFRPAHQADHHTVHREETVSMRQAQEPRHWRVADQRPPVSHLTGRMLANCDIGNWSSQALAPSANSVGRDALVQSLRHRLRRLTFRKRTLVRVL